MSPDLSDRDKERFNKLREKLGGVERAESTSNRLEERPGPIDPMLASTFDGNLGDVVEGEWIAEQKYDGTRIILEKFDGEVALYTRRHIDRADTLSELTQVASEVLPDGLILDGEYTFLRPDGLSRFLPIHTAGQTVETEELTPRYFVFDILATDHEWCTRESLMTRKDRLDEIVPEMELMEGLPYVDAEFQAFYDDLVEMGEEGIVIKRRGSGYHLGTRSEHWQKVKSFYETDVVVVGYTPGEGRRSDTFGALVMTDGEKYIGRVGSGFTEADLELLVTEMEPVDDRPVPVEMVGKAYTPVEPFVVQVKYQAVTDSEELRAPVFLRWQPDKPVAEVDRIPTSG